MEIACEPKSTTLQNALENLQTLDSSGLQAAYDAQIPADLAPERSFWLQYSAAEVDIGLSACLLVLEVTKTLVPREFQLKATIAMMTNKDCLIDVGTNSGKTLCMALPCMLRPKEMSIIFSPLKRLQIVHVLEFMNKFGVKAVAINEDTPNDQELWKTIENGLFPALFVQPEQLFMIKGHLPRLARLLLDRAFARLVKRIHVDEAHFIYTAGMPLYELPPFREAWGRLAEFRIKIGRSIPVQALSGTQPPHIKKCIIDKLLFDESTMVSIKLTSNRPNTIYATHPIAGELSDFRNLNFLVPENCLMPKDLPKTIVFHDNSVECASAALHLDRRLHPSCWGKGVVRHYHSQMSTKYLTEVYEDFSNPNGRCRILHATSGVSTGLDIPDIDIVVQYGIPREVSSTLQRGGRGGRNSKKKAIFLIMYETWVLDIDLSPEEPADPDYPNNGKLTKQSTKRQRTGRAMISAIQSRAICLRKIFAKYLRDMSIEALDFTFGQCCDRHPDSAFNISDFLPGQLLYQDGNRLFYGAENDLQRREILPPKKDKRRSTIRTRKLKERTELKTRLLLWRAKEHLEDPLGSVRPPSFILDDNSIKILAALHPSNVTNTSSIVIPLNETAEWDGEWSMKILGVIQAYDEELQSTQKAAALEKRASAKRQKTALDTAGFKADSERRFQESVAQGHSRFANT